MPLSMVIFDDGVKVAPLTDLRPASHIRTGAFTTLDRWKHRYAGSHQVSTTPTFGVDSILINGRCPLAPLDPASLKIGDAVVESESGSLIMAHVRAQDVARVIAGDFDGLAKHTTPFGTLISRPWHVRSLRDRCLASDLALFAETTAPAAPPAGAVLIGDRGLRMAKNAMVYPSVILDTEAGMIVIDEHATIRPGAILIGPCYVGPHSTVLERATIRPHTAIGPWCKVNGEVGGTIFQGYSNKAHDGYLGDSWIGEWVNFGAGTTNSNLLNTYGEVIAKATPDGKNERTGEQFLGAIVGDHTKTAICTRIMTGSVLHTGGMFASTAPVSGTTPPFAWVTDAGARSYRLDKFLEVARAAMARRKVVPDDAYLNAVRALHGALTPAG